MKYKILWLTLVLALLVVPTASALDFDNVKYFDQGQNKVTVVNAFGLGDNIAYIKLVTPNDVRVPLGYHKVAELNFVNSGHT